MSASELELPDVRASGMRLCPHGFHHPTNNPDSPHSCDGCWCEGVRDQRYGWNHDTSPASELSDRERAIARNEIAAAVERVQGFTRLDIRYGIAGQVIDALTRVGWAPNAPTAHV